MVTFHSRCGCPPFQPLLHKVHVAGGGGKKIALLVHARDGSVIDDGAELIAEHGVTHTADRQGGELMGKNQIEQAAGITPFDFDLSQGADVDDAGTFAHGAVFLFDAGSCCLVPAGS
jgi:hypothetical protein